MFYIEVDENTVREIVIGSADYLEQLGKHGQRWQIKEEVLPEVFLSTVFLEFDHNHSGSGAPVLWESCAFMGDKSEVLARYTSRADAIRGHKLLAANAKAFGLTTLGRFNQLLRHMRGDDE
jgi:hypothetical protein